jgi:hypothetical protein
VYIATDEMAPSQMYFGTVDVLATDIFGIQMTEPFIFAFTTSIATSMDASKASGVTIYPNPATDIIQVSGMDVASVAVYSLAGQMVKKVDHAPVISVSDIKTGVYVVAVTGVNSDVVRKMVVIE